MEASVGLIYAICVLAIVLAFVYAVYLALWVKKQKQENKTITRVADLIRSGANTFMRKEYAVLAVFALVVGALIFLLLPEPIWHGHGWQPNLKMTLCYLAGAIFSGIAGKIGIFVASLANARCAEAATHGIKPAFLVGFRGGAVMGLTVVGACLLGVMGVMVLVGDPSMMLGFSFGASSLALFAKAGGGIFTKTADVSADLAGKVELGIPEDDPRNPATIADNVGDNVGDVAGMGADLYESYAGSILATAALGAALPVALGDIQMKAVIAPMLVSAIGIILSIAGVYFVRTKESATPKALLHALLLGTGGSSALILVVLAIMAAFDWITWGVFGSAVSGLLAGVIIGQSTEYYTSDGNKPTQGIAKQALQGPATVIIEGIAVGMASTWIPVVTIVAGIIAAYGFAGGFSNFAMGVYGIGFAAVGMLSTLGITLATDAFGPIADNAGGNAEMSELPKEVRERTDALDGLGNTTAATGKGFAIGSAALTALALMAAYLEEVRLWLGRLIDKAPEGFKQIGDTLFYNSTVPAVQDGQTAVQITSASVRDFAAAYDLTVFNPILLSGVFIGGMMAFLFSSMSMKAVGRAAGKMVDEVRRQFREIPGIMEGTGKPEYAKCVEISTKGAQSEMIVPSMIAIVVPLLVGWLFGVAGVIGLLAGGMTTGFVLATKLNNAGGAWDNAKKYIERGFHGGKGSEAHKAAVVGDTVGDPFKDTSGPALNILIKLMSMVSVVLAGLTVTWSILG